MTEIPTGMKVRRTLALDARQHLSWRGSYWQRLALPDPWSTWKLSAVPAGLRLIRKYKPKIIWSTYPIATAHAIAAILHERSGIPWVADFRDVMVEADYPADRTVRTAFENIEQLTISNAERVVVTTPGTKDLYMSRFPHEPAHKWHCIRNGFDEENFLAAEQLREEPKDRRLHLLHSGLLYPSERDPTCFFRALQSLKSRGIVGAGTVRITFRSTGHDEYHQRLVDQLDIGDIVQLKPGVSYSAALSEMINADGLLLFQASSCNNQIPAKLYEYLRTGRPILAFTDPEGDTARTMREEGLDLIFRLDNAQQIEDGFERFLNEMEEGTVRTVHVESIKRYSRREQTSELVRMLDVMVC